MYISESYIPFSFTRSLTHQVPPSSRPSNHIFSKMLFFRNNGSASTKISKVAACTTETNGLLTTNF